MRSSRGVCLFGVSHRDGEFLSFEGKHSPHFPLYKPRFGCSETMGYRLEPRNPGEMSQSWGRSGEDSFDGCLLGKTELQGTKRKPSGIKT